SSAPSSSSRSASPSVASTNGSMSATKRSSRWTTATTGAWASASSARERGGIDALSAGGMLHSLTDGLPELHHDADDGQDRLLRSWPLREDHQPALDPQQDRAALAGRDGEPRDRDRPHALLRSPPPGRGRHRGHEGPPPALHRARPGL